MENVMMAWFSDIGYYEHNFFSSHQPGGKEEGEEVINGSMEIFCRLECSTLPDSNEKLKAQIHL